MLLYLARHAQTASSAVDSFNGQRELPLTEQGRAQARALGERLRDVHFAAVYCSPLGRTGETARLIAPSSLPVILPGLIEIDYGAWEGLSSPEAQSRDPDRYAAWVDDPAVTGPPGGETAAQIATRALAALEFIQSSHSASGATGPVLAVSHKATLRVLGAALAGVSVSSYRTRLAQDECALNLIELRKGKHPFIRLWNDTGHLGPDPGVNTRGGK